jgi:hypothetical protein
MDGPWFRRYAGFGYKRTTWQGPVVIALMGAAFVSCGALWISLVETRPTLAWIIGGFGFVAAVVGHAVVLWKMDWDYTES